jgi:hypothetical protein
LFNKKILVLKTDYKRTSRPNVFPIFFIPSFFFFTAVRLKLLEKKGSKLRFYQEKKDRRMLRDPHVLC